MSQSKKFRPGNAVTDKGILTSYPIGIQKTNSTNSAPTLGIVTNHSNATGTLDITSSWKNNTMTHSHSTRTSVQFDG